VIVTVQANVTSALTNIHPFLIWLLMYQHSNNNTNIQASLPPRPNKMKP
ncbi:uncharacterized protein METZ01_LOCUS511001, partial [marine metagenome]